MIAADPDLIGWLATSKARTVLRLAADLSSAGYKEAAELAQQFAQGLTNGGVSPL